MKKEADCATRRRWWQMTGYGAGRAISERCSLSVANPHIFFDEPDAAGAPAKRRAQGSGGCAARRARRAHAGVVLALWVCSVQPAVGACEPLDIPDAEIEIVPTECSFWRQAGLVRPKGSNADAKTAIKWNLDCGVPIGHKEIRFSAPGDGRMGVEDSLEKKAEPIALSDMGSQTKLTFRTCDGKPESTAVESIFRSWTTPGGRVLATTSLEYSMSSGSSPQEAGEAPWFLKANRFPVASFQIDFFLTTNGSDFGDRVARADIPQELINPVNKTLAKLGGYSGTLCIDRPDGEKGYAPKWLVEFFTSDRALRRAVVGAVVAKAVRDNRRSPTTGELVDNDCRSTYLANSIGIPICLFALAGVAGLLLGTNILSGLMSLYNMYTSKVEDEPDPDDVILGTASLRDVPALPPSVFLCVSL